MTGPASGMRALDEDPAVPPAERGRAVTASMRPGLTQSEAERRLLHDGPNALVRQRTARWPKELVRQLTHPLALLLWVAAALSAATGSTTLACVILGVIAVNAAFATR